MRCNGSGGGGKDIGEELGFQYAIALVSCTRRIVPSNTTPYDFKKKGHWGRAWASGHSIEVDHGGVLDQVGGQGGASLSGNLL